MDIFLTVHKRDFYQQTVTTVLPPSYLVTGHQIRSLPPTYTSPKKKGGGWKGNQGKKTFKESKLAAQIGRTLWKIKLSFSSPCNILHKSLNQAGMTWKEWD